MVYPDCRWGVVMFRCTKELKGLAIDYDGFDKISIEKWEKVNRITKCIFIGAF